MYGQAFSRSTLFPVTKRRPTESFGTHVYNTSNNIFKFTKLRSALQRIKLDIEIVDLILKPMTRSDLTELTRSVGRRKRGLSSVLKDS